MSAENKKSSLVLDRIEGNKAVLLDGKEEIVIRKKYLPDGVKEGDILKLINDTLETQQSQKSARELLNEILRQH